MDNKVLDPFTLTEHKIEYIFNRLALTNQKKYKKLSREYDRRFLLYKIKSIFWKIHKNENIIENDIDDWYWFVCDLIEEYEQYIK